MLNAKKSEWVHFSPTNLHALCLGVNDYTKYRAMGMSLLVGLWFGPLTFVKLHSQMYCYMSIIFVLFCFLSLLSFNTFTLLLVGNSIESVSCPCTRLSKAILPFLHPIIQNSYSSGYVPLCLHWNPFRLIKTLPYDCLYCGSIYRP